MEFKGTNQELIDIIGSIVDDDFGKTLNELGAIKNAEVIQGKAVAEIELTQPIHYAAERINAKIDAAIKEKYPGAESEISITEKPFAIPARDVLKQTKNIVAVASGKGGVGKSAVTANLAAALSLAGAKVGVLDSDIYGPSQPTMFGLAETPMQAVEKDDGSTMAFPLESRGVKVASMGFVMNSKQAAIVRGPLLASYFSMLVEQVEWGALDYLLFDLPPGTGDVQLTLTQKFPLTGAITVTTPQEISLADARRAIYMFEKVNVKTLGVVENMSYFTPPDMPDKKYRIFGEGGGKSLAEEYSIEMLGEIPLDSAMREKGDSGDPIVFAEPASIPAKAFNETAKKIESQIRRINAENENAGAPEIEI